MFYSSIQSSVVVQRTLSVENSSERKEAEAVGAEGWAPLAYCFPATRIEQDFISSSKENFRLQLTGARDCFPDYRWKERADLRGLAGGGGSEKEAGGRGAEKRGVAKNPLCYFKSFFCGSLFRPPSACRLRLFIFVSRTVSGESEVRQCAKHKSAEEWRRRVSNKLPFATFNEPWSYPQDFK